MNEEWFQNTLIDLKERNSSFPNLMIILGSHTTIENKIPSPIISTEEKKENKNKSKKSSNSLDSTVYFSELIIGPVLNKQTNKLKMILMLRESLLRRLTKLKILF